MKGIIRKLMFAAVFAVALVLFAVPSKAEALTLADLNFFISVQAPNVTQSKGFH